MKKKNLLGLDRDELTEIAVDLGERPFRGKQLFSQIYRRKLADFQEMTDLSRDFRRRLQEHYCIESVEVASQQESCDGTVKFLSRLADGKFIESVYIPEEGRDTLCISSQVGCDVGCTFCLTARMRFQRNLQPGEIIGQVLTAIGLNYLKDNGFNVVFMGMGEPLYNYKNVMKAFRLMVDPEGLNLSYRKITVSTSGIVPVLRRMAGETLVPNLAVSLNAASDGRRNELMPINRRWPLDELLRVCHDFKPDQRRRITFEYVLLAGVTDSDEDARCLARLLKGRKAKVNLIPFNPNPGLPYRRPSARRIDAFREILSQQDVPVFVRKTRGDDVSAACGQLAYLETAQ